MTTYQTFAEENFEESDETSFDYQSENVFILDSEAESKFYYADQNENENELYYEKVNDYQKKTFSDFVKIETNCRNCFEFFSFKFKLH